MDGAARIRTALALGRPDRPPAGWWGHTFRQEWSPAALAAVTVERARRHGWDYVKLQPRATCFAEAFGAQFRPSEDGAAAPAAVRPAVGDAADLAALPVVTADAPSLADQVSALAMVVSELGPGVPVLQTVFSPLTVLGYLLGGDKGAAVRMLRDRPDEVVPALDRIGAALLDFSARSVAAGAAGVFYAISGYASAGGVHAAEYERLALPADRRVLESLPDAAWFNALHLCGAAVHFDLAGRLPVQAVSWAVHDAGNPSLVEGRERAGRAVMGGVAQKTTLSGGGPDDAADEVRSAVEETGGAGFILAPGCSVPPEAPEENLKAMMEAVVTG